MLTEAIDCCLAATEGVCIACNRVWIQLPLSTADSILLLPASLLQTIIIIAVITDPLITSARMSSLKRLHASNAHGNAAVTVVGQSLQSTSADTHADAADQSSRKRRKTSLSVNSNGAGATSAEAATAGETANTTASATIFSLHTVERQIIMHYCDRRSSLQFARTCKRMYAEAQHSFPHRHQPHMSVKCNDAAEVEGFLRSPLLRHFPAIEAAIYDESTLSGEHSFTRLLSSGLVHAVTVRTWASREIFTLLENFIDVLQHRTADSVAHNIRSLALQFPLGTYIRTSSGSEHKRMCNILTAMVHD